MHPANLRYRERLSLFGAALHLGGGGSPSGNTTTVQKSDPWEGQQPYLKEQMGEAQKLYQSKTPQYNMDAYNQAVKQWDTQNAGQAPQYDTNAYNTALSAYNSAPNANAMDWSAWVKTLPTNERGTRSGATQGNYDKYVAGLPKGNTGPAPTMEQYLIPGPGGAKPKMSDFTIPGTEGASGLAPAYYPNKTIADQSPETLAAQALTTQRALAGSPVQNQANGLLNDTLAGNYLMPGSNPYLDATFNNAADQVQGRVNSVFGHGRFGSGIHQEILARELGKTATDVYGKNYDNERTRQMQGLLFAPQMANQDYFDISQLAGVGQRKEGRAQALINEDVNKYNYNQNLPSNALRNYIGLTGGNYGGTATSTQPYFQNQGAGMLGGALGGGMLGSQIAPLLGFAGPWGMAAGAGLGLLSGLM